MAADSGTEKRTENGTAPPQLKKGDFDRIRRLVEAKSDDRAKRASSRLVTWDERDAFLKTCIDFGLSQTQICEFSLSWPSPMTTVQQVSDRVEALGLRTMFWRRERKRVGYHNQAINKTFIRLAGQFMEYGYSIEQVTREKKVFDEGPLRPDYSFVARLKKSLLYLVEIQASKSKHTLWFSKLRQYVRLYELLKIPFKVLIIVHSPDEMTRAKAGAREALAKHPNLNLFLFALITDIEFAKRDVVGGAIWECAWRGMKPGPLVRC